MRDKPSSLICPTLIDEEKVYIFFDLFCVVIVFFVVDEPIVVVVVVEQVEAGVVKRRMRRDAVGSIV